MITTRLALIAQGRLKLHRLIRILLQIVRAGGCSAARIAKVWPRTERIYAIVVIAIIGMALETNLVLARHMTRGDRRTCTQALLDFIRNR